MKVRINHSKFAKALSYTSKAVSQKPNIPILSNVLLEASENSLKLSATNLDMGIRMWIPVQVDEPGSITVNAKYIADYISATASNSESVALELDNSVVKVMSETSKGSFATILSDEFPVLPSLQETPLFSIDSIEFTRSMDKVSFSCSTDLSAGRIQQSGVLFEFDESKKTVSFIGLDGFRLSKRECEVKNLKKDISKDEIIVPAKHLNEFVRIVQDNSDAENIDVYLSENGSQIILTCNDIEFSIRLLEGPYPEYKKIMPDSSSFTFEVNKSELEDAIKVTNTFARGNLGNKTFFDFDVETGIVTLSSAVAEVGEGETKISVKDPVGESDLKTAYTLRYLQDVVNHIEGDKIIFETKGALAASVFKDNDDDKYIHLVMPMRRE
jgi:DNA polymerase-3 subunit beta